MRKKTGSKTSSGLNKRKTMMDTNADRSKPRKLEPEVYVNRCYEWERELTWLRKEKIGNSRGEVDKGAGMDTEI